MATLQVPLRGKSTGNAPVTKAVILVCCKSGWWEYHKYDAIHIASRQTFHTNTCSQVGGPSRGTRFRPLSLDLPKVCTT